MKYLFAIVLPLFLISCSSDEKTEASENVQPEDFYGTYEIDGSSGYILEIEPDGKVYLTLGDNREVADWKWVEEGKSMDWIADDRTIGVELKLEDGQLTVTDEHGNKMVYNKLDQE